MSAMQLTPMMLCREGLQLFSTYRLDPGLPHEILSPEWKQYEVVFTLLPEDLSLSLEDISRRLIAPAMANLARLVPAGEFIRLPTSVEPPSAVEKYRGVWLRFSIGKDVTMHFTVGRFDVLIQPDEWEISG